MNEQLKASEQEWKRDREGGSKALWIIGFQNVFTTLAGKMFAQEIKF